MISASRKSSAYRSKENPSHLPMTRESVKLYTTSRRMGAYMNTSTATQSATESIFFTISSHLLPRGRP